MLINIFGTLDTAVKFLLNNPDLNVNVFIDGVISEESKIDFPFTSYKVLPFNNAENDLKKCYTVVATSDSTYFKIKKRLEDVYGLKEFEDFEPCSTFRKKVVICYGNCYFLMLSKHLNSYREFISNYGIYPITGVYHLLGNNDFEIKFPKTAFDRCCVFIYQHVSKEVNKTFIGAISSDEALRKLPKSCNKICIPNFVSQPNFLFPQNFDDNCSININKFCLFFKKDKFIESHWQTQSIDKIAYEIKTENFFDLSEIKKNFDSFISKIEYLDTRWDVPVVEFIKLNYRKEKLFFEEKHPTQNFMKYIGDKIVEYILNTKICKLIQINYDEFVFDTLEQPIYHSTKIALKLEFEESKYLRQNSTFKLSNNKVDLREYVKQYLLWFHPQFFKK